MRRAWTFDGSDRVPDAAAIERLMPLVGFDKIRWESPYLTLPAGMELDFGGFGKEYAVDRAYDLMAARRPAAFLINFGGELRADRRPPHGPWQIGVERPDTDRQATLILELEHGALATSGDSRRYLLKARRALQPCSRIRARAGRAPHAPRSVTVAASSCTEAGLLATPRRWTAPGRTNFWRNKVFATGCCHDAAQTVRRL